MAQKQQLRPSGVREFRDREGITLQQWSDASGGVDTGHLSRIERGVSRPSPRVRNVLVAGLVSLGADRDEILEFVDDEVHGAVA